MPQVYPRVGGGNGSTTTPARSALGLSPRGRGKRRGDRAAADRIRSIPAWAGETNAGVTPPVMSAVYPRVGGGNGDTSGEAAKGVGLSPRGRGKPTARVNAYARARSIPAWAGETQCAGGKRPTCWVYPRVGGGNHCGNLNHCADGGLSPRGRGKPIALLKRSRRLWSIPAWAGETRARSRRCSPTAVYPRVGGGNREWIDSIKESRGLSPRGRGKPRL